MGLHVQTSNYHVIRVGNTTVILFIVCLFVISNVP